MDEVMPLRKRITITVRKDLLRGLDHTIDNRRVRNRSHAFEVMLSRLLDPRTNQALILASGEGIKMRPFTYEIPKPLIPVHGRPLLEHSIDLLRRHQITNIVITVSHLADKIKDHFGDGSAFGVSIQYVEEKKPSGTAGAVKAARKKLAGQPFVMLYGDVLLNVDIGDFLQAHEEGSSAVGTLALTSVADPSAFGAVKMRGTQIVEFSEKPGSSTDVSRLVFAGLGAFNSSVFDFLRSRSSKKELSLERDIFPKLIAAKKLGGYPFEGQWFDVSTPEAYERAVKKWKP